VSHAPGGDEPLLSAYRELLALSELELELAGRGEIDALDALGARWQELRAALPATAPAKVAPILSRARVLHERTRVELLRVHEQLLAEAATAGRARRTAQGYGSELQARVRVEASA
jgi:hypothetical protein